MSMDYIRRVYEVPAKRGAIVEYMAGDGERLRGTIVGAKGPYLRIRLDGNNRAMNFHPTWHLTYIGAEI